MTETTTQEIAALTSPPLLDTRPGHIFWRSLQDSLGGVLGWGIGFSLLVMLVAVLYPLLEQSNTMLTVVQGLGILDVMLVGRDLEDITSFGGYLAVQVLSWGPLILSVYLVPQTMQAIAQEERQGTLDILLSTPISRWRLLVEKSLAVVVALLGILVLIWLSLVFSAYFLVDAELPFVNSLAGVWHMFPMLAFILSSTLLFSVILRQPRHASSAAIILVVGSYFLRMVADRTPTPLLDSLRRFTPYNYYRSIDAMANGFQWQNDVVLLSASAAVFLLAVFAFQRRDLRV